MSDQEVDTIIKQLKDIRLERTETLARLEDINKSEIELIKSIHRAKQASLKEKGSNPFVTGDILRINNHLLDEFGTVGKVWKACNTKVHIRNSDTGKDYSRAWCDNI